MARLIIACLFACGAALAQFTALATDRSGDRVLFLTTFRQAGSEQIADPKLFVRAPDGGLTLLYAPAETGDPFVGGMSIAESISVSSDGRIAGLSGRTSCVGGSSCSYRILEWGFALDVASGASLTTGVTAVVSRNGRYIGSKSPGSGPPGQLIPVKVIDLLTGETRNRDLGYAFGISDSGDVIMSDRIVRWNGEVEPMSFQGRNIQADQGFTRFALEKFGSRQVFAFDRTTGREWPLSPTDRPSYGSRISEDGRHVLYMTELGGVAQLMLVGWDGSYWKQLTAEGEGILSGALSGDGRIVWAGTGDGRLLRIDAETLQTREVLAPPVLRRPFAITPGSLVRIQGHRLSPDIKVEDSPLYVVSASNSEVLAQVPWEAKGPDPPRHRSFPYLLLTARNEGSPLEWISPRFTVGLGSVIEPWSSSLIHEDWTSFVTADRPATRGETLHFYATRLGATECRIETGQPAPSDRACSALQRPWLRWCAYNERCPQAELRFAGLAPGMLGLYQIDVVVPSDSPGPTAVLMGPSSTWKFEIPLSP